MKYILTLLIGAVLGGALVFYFLVGVPAARKPTGAVVRAPEAGGDPPGTAIVFLDEKFFDALLGSVFRDLGAPSFKLSSLHQEQGTLPEIRNAVFQQGDCTNAVVLAPEGNNVKTSVQLVDGKIQAPLVFSGSYNVPLMGCTRFKGWAQANLQLSFDQAKQTVYGQVNVEGVNLENVSPLLNGPITLFVQSAINQRVNPIEVLRGQQLTLNIPVQASGGTLKMQAKDVRSDVKDGTLRLHITYDFSGAKGQT
jgi:hypothetical protein